jgi:hypothetical protein
VLPDAGGIAAGDGATTGRRTTRQPRRNRGKTEAKKEPSEAQKKQQERMKACNEKAGDKKSRDDRKNFMSTCLKGDDGPVRQAEGAAGQDDGMQQDGRREEARGRRSARNS